MRWTTRVAALCLIGASATCNLAQAQIDLAGQWRSTTHEDAPTRGDGPELGDYTGLPINAAARQMAQSWDASILSQPELQTRAHPAQYSLYGPGPNLRISEIRDDITDVIRAYRIEGTYGRADRTIWMDGRAHPSTYAAHTYDGFSTGEWLGSTLKVTTSHMKMAFIQRNGVPSSPHAKMTIYFTRRGNHLMAFVWIDDPLYLEEPMVRTSQWTLSPTQEIPTPVPFDSVDELGATGPGWVPHFPLGTEHRDFAERHGLPYEATLGGSRALYPEYQREIAKMEIKPAARAALP